MTEFLTPYERIGERAGIARLVARFYDLMDSDAAYRELRAMHGPDLQPMVDSLTGFLCAWTGGPRDWFEQRPGACVMSAHMALPGMATKVADQWIGAMSQAGRETLDHDPEQLAVLLEAMDRMCRVMVANAEAMRAGS